VGTVYLRADQNYAYGAFDITGWTNPGSGFLLGFGVQKGTGGYPAGTWIEFQQANSEQGWGGTVGTNSGTMNGLVSAYRENTVIQGSIPVGLQAKDSFATGHRVWEVQMPLTFLGGLNVGVPIDIVGGINFNSQVHWYPAAFGAVPYSSFKEDNYARITVESAPSAVPEPAGMFALAGLLSSGMLLRSRRKAIN